MVKLLWLLLGMMGFIALYLTVVCRIEKLMTWPYGDLDPAPAFPDPTGYGTRWMADAVQCGFSFLGWARDIKGPTYRISYAVLVSSNRDVLAIIGVGSILKIPLAGTWLHSPAIDGRSYFSVDKQSCVSIDLSRHWRNQLAPSSTFGALLQKHREWLTSLGVSPRLFTPGHEFSEFRALREEHFRSMERAGLIRFTDSSATHFRFTLFGAARTAISGYFLGMARQLTNGRFPRTL